MTRPARLAAALTAVLSIGALTACDDEQLDDAPVGIIDDSPTFVITNADQFPNIAIRCFGVNGIYTTTRDYGDAVNIIVNDPECVDGDPVPEDRK